MKQGHWAWVAEDDRILYCECGGKVDEDYFCTKCLECVDPYDDEDTDVEVFL